MRLVRFWKRAVQPTSVGAELLMSSPTLAMPPVNDAPPPQGTVPGGHEIEPPVPAWPGGIGIAPLFTIA